MFEGCTNFNKNINIWKTNNVTNLKKSFYNATSFNQSLKYWNTYNCRDFTQTFSNATSFNNDIRYWYIDYSSNVDNMFDSCPCVETYPIPRPHIFIYTIDNTSTLLSSLIDKDSTNQPFIISDNNMNFKIDNLISVDNGDGTTTITIKFSHNFINRKNQIKAR